MSEVHTSRYMELVARKLTKTEKEFFFTLSIALLIMSPVLAAIFVSLLND